MFIVWRIACSRLTWLVLGQTVSLHCCLHGSPYSQNPDSLMCLPWRVMEDTSCSMQVGQTFIIACAVLLHNLVELAGYAGKDAVARDGHLFSAYLMLPLATTSLALLRFNW